MFKVSQVLDLVWAALFQLSFFTEETSWMQTAQSFWILQFDWFADSFHLPAIQVLQKIYKTTDPLTEWQKAFSFYLFHFFTILFSISSGSVSSDQSLHVVRLKFSLKYL